jgi:hypothetical protein
MTETIIGASVTIIGGLFALFRWTVSELKKQNEEKRERIEELEKKNNELTERLLKSRGTAKK